MADAINDKLAFVRCSSCTTMTIDYGLERARPEGLNVDVDVEP